MPKPASSLASEFCLNPQTGSTSDGQGSSSARSAKPTTVVPSLWSKQVGLNLLWMEKKLGCCCRRHSQIHRWPWHASGGNPHFFAFLGRCCPVASLQVDGKDGLRRFGTVLEVDAEKGGKKVKLDLEPKDEDEAEPASVTWTLSSTDGWLALSMTLWAFRRRPKRSLSLALHWIGADAKAQKTWCKNWQEKTWESLHLGVQGFRGGWWFWEDRGAVLAEKLRTRRRDRRVHTGQVNAYGPRSLAFWGDLPAGCDAFPLVKKGYLTNII